MSIENPQFAPETLVPIEQVASLHDEAERLFSIAKQPFGTYGNIVRYQSGDGDLVKVEASALFCEQSDGPEPNTSSLNVHIDSPLPRTNLWPNAYITETFTIMGGEGFDYGIKLHEYTINGELDRRYEEAMETEMTPTGNQVIPSQDPTDAEMTKLSEIKALKAHRLKVARQDHPEHMKRFQRKCTPEHFVGRLMMLSGLSREHEVGSLSGLYVVAED